MEKDGAPTLRGLLEGDLRGHLQAARTASPEEGVADTDVARCRQGIESNSPARTVDTVHSGVGDEVWQLRICEVRMIEDVEELGPKRQLHTLGKLSILEH